MASALVSKVEAIAALTALPPPSTLEPVDGTERVGISVKIRSLADGQGSRTLTIYILSESVPQPPGRVTTRVGPPYFYANAERAL